jgi:hypothetical protein
MAEGVAGLLRDKTRPSRIPALASHVTERVVALTLTDAPGETTHWTADLMVTAMAGESQPISATAVRRIWKTHGLQPHRYRQFKLSNDPKFGDKLLDVVGLYVNPPAHAIVFSFDEKSQIQALDRTQPGLPLKKGRLGTMTHDYKRNGTTTLFAALNVLDGTVIGQNMQKHRHQGHSYHIGQLRRPQTPQSSRLAGSPYPLYLPLHTNFMLMAQCSRGLLRHSHKTTPQTRRLPLRR